MSLYESTLTCEVFPSNSTEMPMHGMDLLSTVTWNQSLPSEYMAVLVTGTIQAAVQTPELHRVIPFEESRTLNEQPAPFQNISSG